MKLTDELEDKVDMAETMEEKEDIIAEAGTELNDDDVEGVAGGFTERSKVARCTRCKFRVVLKDFDPVPKSCPRCRGRISIAYI